MAIETNLSLVEQAKYGWLSTILDGKLATKLSKLKRVRKEELFQVKFKLLITSVLLVALGTFIGALAVSQVTRYDTAQKFLFDDTTINCNLHPKASSRIVPKVRNDTSNSSHSQMKTESDIHPEVGNDIPSNASSSSSNIHPNASSTDILHPNASSINILHPINASSTDHIHANASISRTLHPNASVTNIHPHASDNKCMQPPKSNDWHWKGFPMQHDLTDEELFTIASIDASVVGRPKKYIQKIAFMFLTKGPLPLRPLWEEFFKGHEKYFSIYVHSSPKLTYDIELPSLFHGRNIPSQDVEWGDMSMMDAERRLLGNALLDFTNERFILVSETCIPLHNFSIVYDYIIHSKHSFVGFVDDPGRDGKGRYNYNMEPEITIDQFQKAPQWFEVNRRLAILIVKDKKYYSKFHSFCKPPCYPDEHYIATLLQINDASHLANRTLTSADWSVPGPHPLLYMKKDITKGLIESLRDEKNCSYNGSPGHLCYLFARKFYRETLEPLQRISHEVLFNG